MSSKHWEIYIETEEVIQRISGFLAEEAVLRISLKGNSIQEDDTLSKLAFGFDFNKVEKLLNIALRFFGLRPWFSVQCFIEAGGF